MHAIRNNLTMQPWQFSLRRLHIALALAPPYLATVAGVFGQASQMLAINISLAALSVVFVNSLVVFGVFLSSRASLRRREALRDRRSVDAPTDRMTQLLKQAVASSRQLEADFEGQYQAAACAAEDVIRARAIRLKAEIDLIRHERAQRFTDRGSPLSTQVDSGKTTGPPSIYPASSS